MEKNLLTAEDSLQVIQSMIERAKDNMRENAFYFLLWGWLVFGAAMLHFMLMKFTSFKQPYIVWSLMVIGAIVTIVKSIRHEKKERVKTFLGDTMKFFGISLGIIFGGLTFVFGANNMWQYSYPVFILVYAAACFFMGSVMKFPYLKWSGLLCLPIMVAAVFLDFQWDLLLLALAVLISYIIPGHILHSKK